MTDTGLTTDQRSELLNIEVARYASKGWTVSSVSGTQAVLQRKKKIGFWLNFFLSVVTAGFWLIVVLVRVINRKVESLILSVDVNGKVNRK
jgi:hypothetical protein